MHFQKTFTQLLNLASVMAVNTQQFLNQIIMKSFHLDYVQL